MRWVSVKKTAQRAVFRKPPDRACEGGVERPARRGAGVPDGPPFESKAPAKGLFHFRKARSPAVGGSNR